MLQRELELPPRHVYPPDPWRLVERRFYPRNLPDIEEAWENEGIEILRNADTPLEPGQSRRFGAVPPADTENPEE